MNQRVARFGLVALGLVALGAAAAGITVVATSGGDDGPGDAAVFDVLAAIPDSADYRSFVVVTDYERAAAAAGLVVPSPEDLEAADQYYVDLTTLPFEEGERLGPVAVLAGFREFREDAAAAWRQAFGFSLLDTRVGGEAGTPPNVIDVFATTVDPAAIDAAVAADERWSDRLTTVSHAGADYYDWGEDFDPERTDAVRPIGVGGQLAVVDGAVVRTTQVTAMQAALTAAGGDGGSLADRDEVREIVDALVARGVYNLLLADSAPPSDPRIPGGVLAPYAWVGAGMALVDGHHQNVIVLRHTDAATAATNAERFEALISDGESAVNAAPWSEVLSVVSIEVEGQTMIAVLDVIEGNPRIWLDAFVRADNLYTVEG